MKLEIIFVPINEYYNKKQAISDIKKYAGTNSIFYSKKRAKKL